MLFPLCGRDSVRLLIRNVVWGCLCRTAAYLGTKVENDSERCKKSEQFVHFFFGSMCKLGMVKGKGIWRGECAVLTGILNCSLARVRYRRFLLGNALILYFLLVNTWEWVVCVSEGTRFIPHFACTCCHSVVSHGKLRSWSWEAEELVVGGEKISRGKRRN